MAVPQAALNAVAHYLDKGLSKHIAVGIVSVLYVESRLNPGSQGSQSTETPGALNPSGAYGIASWNGPRQAALEAFARKKNLPIEAIDTQLDFVLTEIAMSYAKVADAIWPSGLGQPIGKITYKDFIPLFVDFYENPADHQAEIDKAVAFAEQLYLAGTYVTPPVPAPVPAPAPVAIPAPIPQPIGDVMNPALLASLLPLIEQVLVPFVAGLVRNTGPATTPIIPASVVPAPPALDSAAIAAIVAEVMKQLQAKPPA